MSVSEQRLDDQRHDRSAESEAGLDDETVGDRAAAIEVGGQASLVAPPTLEPRRRLFDETSAFLDPDQRQRVPVERDRVEQQEPTPEEHAAPPDRRRQRAVLSPTRHVNERMELVVHTFHRRDEPPDVVHICVHRRDHLELDRTVHYLTLARGFDPARRDWADSHRRH